MTSARLPMAKRWLAGSLIGTLLVAVTSPWFVRSYPPRQFDSVRGVWTLPPGTSYRWRSEGYATTHVGPFGMPGHQGPGSQDANARHRVALWGDSQAEGVCVPDDSKIGTIAERLTQDTERPLVVYPLARSGDAGLDWIHQIPRVETELKVDTHVLLVVEMEDLESIGASSPSTPDPAPAPVNRWLHRLPAFVIQAARNVLTGPDRTTTRALRFSLGPGNTDFDQTSSDRDLSAASTPQATASKQQHLVDACKRLRESTSRPIVLVYAPLVPNIMDGKINRFDANDESVILLAQAAREAGIEFVDTRADMICSVETGVWPRGFHNGQFGVGHYNASGNAILARAVVAGIERAMMPQPITSATDRP